MDVAIKPELEQFVREQVEAGRFSSPAEMIEAGLNMLMFDDELTEEDLKEIEESEREIAAGNVLDWKQVSAELRREFLGE